MSAPATSLFYAPTASGKSALALDWAARTGGTIVNADALQVYDALPLLSACPAPEDYARAPHALYAFADPFVPMTAPKWAELAAQHIAQTSNALLTGGTGLYMTTLLDGIAPIPEVPPETRAESEALFESEGPEAFHARLAAVDPASSGNIHPNHRQRMVRAYEVWLATNEPLSAWHEKPRIKFIKREPRLVVFLPDKAWAVERGVRRFDMMLEQGVIDEVKEFGERGGARAAASQALGFQALWAHVQGQLSLEDARESVVRDTAALIKRQLTWGKMQFAKRDNAIVAETFEGAAALLDT